ncbi:MAG TPA: phasin family protein [Noviherbaspirillum sp.]|uniref:phasin family protein n=1 Tax=Noviherbaspirillum sp. TaxID=1926288 RepID=UPI002D266AF1|nr:phasin family protein [Noviherbaspirillum sp.]HYD96664.1 phasin family protein [Noviherbaspirillum sp.]
MFTIPEQFSAASKANFEAQLSLLTALTNKAFEGVEKVVDLNLNLAKASLEESNAAAKQFLAAKDAQEWLSLAAAQAQPNAEKALAYGRHLAGIASGVQAEFTKAAEAQISETSRKVLELIEEISKNAPAGSENAVAMLKTAIGNANAGYEQLTKTTKQAVETLEANLNNAVGQFTQTAAPKAARAAKK